MGRMVVMPVALQRRGDEIRTRLSATGDRARVSAAKGVA